MALDIIFLSYDEPNADDNFEILIDEFPHAKRVHGIKGINNAHYAAAKIVETRFFYVVDGDSEILPEIFDFSFVPSVHEQKFMHIWKSRNPINNLEYGYGGVKLFNLEFFKNRPNSNEFIDFTTSLAEGIVYHDTVASITHFNSDEFRTWRAAFRECAKLSSATIDRSTEGETERLLNIWLNSPNLDAYCVEAAIDGARQGAKYGRENKNDLEALRCINNFDWLQNRFNQRYENDKENSSTS